MRLYRVIENSNSDFQSPKKKLEALVTLENIYYIGQTVAVIALLVSLAAIWFQIRQANRLAKLESTREIWTNANQMLASQVDAAEKVDFLQRALFSGEKISDAEKSRLYITLSGMFVACENGFAMAQSGMMEDSFWPRMLASMADYLRPAKGRRWWQVARIRTFASNDAFVQVIDKLVAGIEAAEQKEQT